MADFGDPYAAMNTNPYIMSGAVEMPRPDWRQVLGNALLGVGAGISNADASGRGWSSGIGPGLLMGNQMTNKQQQEALQYQMMAGYRKAMEEKARADAEAKREELAMDKEAMGYLRNGLGGAAPGAPTGLAGYQPSPINLGVNPNNVGNVRPVGSNTGFQQPASFDDGVALSVRNARAYPAAFNNGQPMSLLQIGERWAPKGDGANDPAQWAKNVASIGGLPVDQPLDLNDPATAAKFARGVHGAEWGQQFLKPPEAYVPGASMAGSPRVIKVADPSQAVPSGNPQVAVNAPPGAVMPPRVDPMRYAPLTMSKRLAPYGKAMIDIGNTETQRYLADQDRAQKQAQFEQEQRLREAADRRAGFNAKVGDNGQVQQAPIDAEARAAAAKAEAEAKVKLGTDASLKLTADEMARYSKDVRPAIEATVASLPNLYEMKRLTEGPLASGSYIDARQTGARILDTLGIQPMSDGMVNRTEFNNRAGKNVLSFLQTRALGSGSGISEGDRKFVETMAAKGDYTTDEVKRLTDIAISSAHTSVKQHDATVGRLQKLPGVDKIDKGYFDISAPTYDQWAKENAPAGVKTQQMGSTYEPSLDIANIMKNIPQPKSKAEYDALPGGTPYWHPELNAFKVKPKAVKR